MRSIARAAKVSAMTVSRALRNSPGVKEGLRKRICRLAEELGYSPDPRVDNWMARVRDVKSKDLLPLAWLNVSEERDAWHRYRFHSPSLEGARARALELGYKLEEIWTREPGMTMGRLSKVLYQRGIEGVIVTHPARHLRLEWDRFAGVHLGVSLLAPRLHRVMPDLQFNLLLALKSLKRLGYRRIGICIDPNMEIGSQGTLRVLALAFCSNQPRENRVPPLFYGALHSYGREMKKRFVLWLKRNEPEVIVAYDNRLEQWVEEAGYRVPEDIGIVHLAVDDDVLEWAGIHSRRREIGATSVDWLVALIRNHQFGAPKTPLNILIQGAWQMGQTLKSQPKEKTSFTGG